MLCEVFGISATEIWLPQNTVRAPLPVQLPMSSRSPVQEKMCQRTSIDRDALTKLEFVRIGPTDVEID